MVHFYRDHYTRCGKATMLSIEPYMGVWFQLEVVQKNARYVEHQTRLKSMIGQI
jgi:hypothetical protein